MHDHWRAAALHGSRSPAACRDAKVPTVRYVTWIFDCQHVGISNNCHSMRKDMVPLV